MKNFILESNTLFSACVFTIVCSILLMLGWTTAALVYACLSFPFLFLATWAPYMGKVWVCVYLTPAETRTVAEMLSGKRAADIQLYGSFLSPSHAMVGDAPLTPFWAKVKPSKVGPLNWTYAGSKPVRKLSALMESKELARVIRDTDCCFSRPMDVDVWSSKFITACYCARAQFSHTNLRDLLNK